MKIFWSWQSDTPGKTGRHLVRNALNDAIEILKQQPDVEEADREALHLDHDIKDLAGSPDIVQAIFEKIQQSQVVVADVTLVGNVSEQTHSAPESSHKKLINSNVAIELGYAFRHLSSQGVLMVLNAHYGRHEELPFDLRHKGGAIIFTLPPEAGRDVIASQRKELTSQFVVKLKPYLNAQPASNVTFVETPSTYSKAAYFQRGEALVSRYGITYSYDSATMCYLRLLPAAPLPQKTARARLIEKTFGGAPPRSSAPGAGSRIIETSMELSPTTHIPPDPLAARDLRRPRRFS